MSNNVQPIFILPEGTQRTSGKQAQKVNISAAQQVAEQVKSTLGPKGMDKMIVDSLGDVTVTNDGVTILEEMSIEHPSAKMIVEIAKTQEDEVGDGTTTAVVVAGELLKNAESLLDQNVHPTVITKGYRIALEKAIKILNSMSEKVSIEDRKIMKNIVETAMTGKGSEHAKEFLSEIIVNAVKSVSEEKEGKIIINKDDIKLETKVGASVECTEIVKGIILDKERVHTAMPKIIKDAKVALVDSAIEIKNTEIDAKIQITDPSQMQAFLDQEETMLKKMVQKIIDSGANVLICQKGIDDVAQHFLAKNGVYAVRRVKKSDMEKLVRATGAKIITNLEDLSKDDLGHAGLAEEMKVGDEEMTFIKKCENPKSVTIIIRGGTEHVAAEVKRAIEDAIGDLASALRNGAVVGGAGAPEAEVSKGLKEYAKSFSGREQLAINAFANAMEVIPKTLAENAGLDPIDVLTEMKAEHQKGNKWAGIDVFSGQVVDAWEKGVIEPLQIKTQAINSAAEVAMMILRIDDVIAGSGSGNGGMPEMPPGMGGMGGMPPM
ncbi:MAG: thermosome subunit beta [Nanoarchaeota archaeon]|nr:thermosome subunit beta [Nanoarchaeota archaeon]